MSIIIDSISFARFNRSGSHRENQPCRQLLLQAVPRSFPGIRPRWLAAGARCTSIPSCSATGDYWSASAGQTPTVPPRWQTTPKLRTGPSPSRCRSPKSRCSVPRWWCSARRPLHTYQNHDSINSCLCLRNYDTYDGKRSVISPHQVMNPSVMMIAATIVMAHRLTLKTTSKNSARKELSSSRYTKMANLRKKKQIKSHPEVRV